MRLERSVNKLEEILRWMSPGVWHDSMVQGDKISIPRTNDDIKAGLVGAKLVRPRPVQCLRILARLRPVHHVALRTISLHHWHQEALQVARCLRYDVLFQLAIVHCRKGWHASATRKLKKHTRVLIEKDMLQNMWSRNRHISKEVTLLLESSTLLPPNAGRTPAQCWAYSRPMLGVGSSSGVELFQVFTGCGRMEQSSRRFNVCSTLHSHFVCPSSLNSYFCIRALHRPIPVRRRFRLDSKEAKGA